MPGGGIAAASRIAQSAPAAKIVVLTVSEADDDIMAALKVGARGYVLKGVSSGALVDILQGIANGESYVSPSLAARLLTGELIKNFRAASEALEKAIGRNRTEQG
jgi:two-component system nitrate/nitrite response regulator NarL